MNKIGAIVEARMGSSRLPGKILKEANGKVILSLLIERISKVKEINTVIVATTINQKDDVLVEFCKNNGINYFRGSEDDVMGRVLGAASHYHIDTIVEITGDCPLIDYNIISQVLNSYIHNKFDYVSNANIRSYPDGMDVQVFSKNILSDSYLKATTSIEKEHVTLHIRKSDFYSKMDLIAPTNQFYPDLGLTLDEESDYILIKKIFESFDSNDFTLDQILKLLKSDSTLKEINAHVIRKGDS